MSRPSARPSSALVLPTSSLVALSLLGLAVASPAEATNFLVIMLDDLGADKVSSYTADMYPGTTPTYVPDTPAIDGLADVGLRFSDAWANPVCSPTRASLLTGLYPFQHKTGALVPAAQDLDQSLVTLPEMLRDDTPTGYTSGLFGKWHLGDATPGGTDWLVNGEYAEGPAPSLHGFSAYGGNLEGDVWDYYSWTYTQWPLLISGGLTGSTIETNTTWTTDVTVTDAVNWVPTVSGDRFALITMNAPHVDEDGVRDIWELNDLAPEDGGTCIDYNGSGSCSNSENFGTLVEDADRRLQALLEELAADDPEFLEETVIFLMGDNGTAANILETPWSASGTRSGSGKSTAYESGIRIPFIIARGCDWMDQADGSFDGYYDGVTPACTGATPDLVTPGLVVDVPVQVEDVYATIAELAGASTSVPTFSKSLVPCFSASASGAADCESSTLSGRTIYSETFTRGYSVPAGYVTTGRGMSGTAAIQRQGLKIIAEMDATAVPTCMNYEFYDLTTDPAETNNLRASGYTMTPTESAAYESLWLHLRLDIGPDWFSGRDCSGDSVWDADHDTYESATFGGTDCDDTLAAAHPGATEVWYNGIDENCNGGSDYDQDLDSFTTLASGGTDCNDTNANIKPGATDRWYDGIDSNCDGHSDYDQDNDGVDSSSWGGTDCNDTNGAVKPGATEICNGIDDNCSGSVDEGTRTTYYRDTDADGYGLTGSTSVGCSAPSGYVGTPGDCNDANNAVYPGRTETCNGVDDNCSGAIDEGVKTTFFRDVDGDGFGSSTVTTAACSVPVGYVTNSTDCNDANAAVKPSASEVCNGVDDNCSGAIDEGVKTTYYRDVDGDGYGSSTVTTTACTRPAGYVTNSTDCNDANAAIKPSAVETCNGVDDNCSGAVDEGVKTTYYRDADADTYGSATVTTTACSVPAGYVTNSTDCNDASFAIKPGASEVCNGMDDNCSGVVDEGVKTTYYRDADSDSYGAAATTSAACTQPVGFVANRTDCNDSNAAIRPGATEVCNAIDDNCDATIDEGVKTTYYRDVDIDGYGSTTVSTQACTRPGGYLATSGDCNDASAAVNPGASETCNGVDDNCSGAADEGLTTSTWYQDADGDGYGTTGITTTSCAMPAGYVAVAGDCDDASAAVQPGMVETCNGVDDNCSGVADEGVTVVYYGDSDADGYGSSATGVVNACTQPSGYINNSTDCDDASGGVNPAATEVCNSIDDDCDGSVDESAGTVYYADTDGDGYGDASGATVTGCTAPSGYVADTSDCDDALASRNPGASESCNGVDDNCDGATDEGVTSTFHADADGDGYGSFSGATVSGCTAPSGYVANVEDCDDDSAAVNPAATETCDGADEDCNGLVDDGALTTYYVDSDADGYGSTAATTLACSTPSGFAAAAGDCDDSAGAISPDATEVCNGVDDDCDGVTDELGATVYYQDADGDGYGIPSVTTLACSLPSGYSAVSTDCNDGMYSIHPGGVEVCNGVDDSCDGTVDEGVKTTFYRDVDADGYGSPSTTTTACSAPAGYVATNTDCNDTNAAVKPGATEACNGIDDNCNSAVDEGVKVTYYRDADSDTYGTSSPTIVACTQPSGYVANRLDCNDANAAVKPGATEVCNLIDDNCNATVDEGVKTTYYRDADVDTYGSNTISTQACVRPGGYIVTSGDCNDANAAIKPGAVETMNDSVDSNCNGSDNT